MALTEAQMQALKTDIANDQSLNSLPNNSDGNSAIAAAYNQLVDPAYYAWRTQIPVRDCKKATVWTEYIARSAGERDAWQFMLSNGTINAGDTNVRQGIQDIFSGAGGATTRANLLAIAVTPVTRAQQLFASGGTGTTGNPTTLAENFNEFSQVSLQDVDQARNSP